MSNYQHDLEEQERQLALRQFDNDCQTGWLQIQRLYPIAGHMANYAAVKEYCHPFPISLSGFKLMLENERAASTLDLKDDTKKMMREIIYLLREHGKYTEFDLRNEEKRLGIVARQADGREKIKSRLTEITEKQRLAGMSVGAIKQELAANRPQPQVKILPAEFTREKIHAMPSHEIRKLIRDFTATVVNDRLFGRN